MTVNLYLAPAGHGKTAYVLERIRRLRAADPLAAITVILPNQAQVSAFRHRLAASGGGLGISLGTFYTLYPDLLARAGQPAPRLPEPVQFRLIRAIVERLTDEQPLLHYAPLRDKPGFVLTLRALLEELKQAGIRRENFRQAIHALPHPPARLTELADIYVAYQDWLLAHGWADTEGQGWLAALALERQPQLSRHLRLLIVDGFDQFNPTQLAALRLLAGRAAETIITLTGDGGASAPPRSALRRFTRAQHAVSHSLSLSPQPLPSPHPAPFAPPLAHLQANLFNPAAPRQPAGPAALTLLEAQNRAEEVRAALRWLKARLLRDHMAPPDVALLARDLTLYRPFIEETAAEFGLTLHLREGLTLSENPAVAALMSLLALPTTADNGSGNWARRPVIEAWRSPYFENLAPHLTPGDADQLDAAARAGLVVQSLEQWQPALDQLVAQAALREAQPDSAAALLDEDTARPDQLSHAAALALQQQFDAFVARLTPPAQETLPAFAAFVEELIGDDPQLAAAPPDDDPAARSLRLVDRARAVPATAARDIAALRAFKDILRGLVLAETSLTAAPLPRLSYTQFFDELRSAVQGALYHPPPPEPAHAALPALSVMNARGLSFRAVALIGLAEGEFPRQEREDILLREEDRLALRQAGLSTLESRLHGDEISFFYQAVTRAREKLLLCRPYLADDGQPWEPSPYWQEVRRLVDAPLHHIRPEDPLPLSEVASLPEFVQAAAQLNLLDAPLLRQHLAAETAALRHRAAVLHSRLAPRPHGPFEGDLTELTGHFAATYGPEHIWSASRLEAYGLCPHHFWLGQELTLEPRQPPQPGFDILILGSMYHEILEEIYKQAGAEATAERLLALLPAVAKKVFDAAPAQYGFRPTPLWQVQRRELEQIMSQTVAALAEATAGGAPLAQEQSFGLHGQPPLVLRRGEDEVRVRGFIDRVDQTADGRLVIIDYKSGSTPIAARDLAEGRRLQIALYALAARNALALGDIAEGFYWHIGSAKASSLKLATFEGGVETALQTAQEHVFQHVAGVRGGHFAPAPPPSGCPGHCPGLKICWRYQSKGW